MSAARTDQVVRAIAGEPVSAGSRWQRRVASWLRSLFWAMMFALRSDGLRVEGSLPPGPCVLVANHSSHADTAVLLAAFGRGRPLLTVAAADYWRASGRRRALALTLVGILPVERENAGACGLDAALAALAAGTSIVIFPEGTRSRDGQLGRFRSGASRLAGRAGVPVVPIGLAGIAALLPVHRRRFTRNPVTVRVGPPLPAPPAGSDRVPVAAHVEATRDAVAALAAAPAEPGPGRTWRRLSARAAGRSGVLILSVWAFAEALSWPLIAELPLIGLMAVAHLRRVPVLISATVAGSMLGILLNWGLAGQGVLLPAPLTTDRMRVAAAAQLRADPTAAIQEQTDNGIPVKVYAQQAGVQQLSAGELIPALWPRVLRTLLVGSVAWLLARPLRRRLAPCLGAVTIVGMLLVWMVLWRLVTSWQ